MRQHPLELTCVPQKVDRVVKTFCADVAAGMRPVYVPVQVEPDAQPLECYGNVASLVSRAGGEAVHGWAIWTIPQILIEAEHHAVWRSPSGTLIDPTPHDPPSDSILFLPDPTAIFTGRSIDRRRKALTPDPLVAHLIARAEARARIEASVRPGQEISIPKQVYADLWIGDPDFGRSIR